MRSRNLIVAAGLAAAVLAGVAIREASGTARQSASASSTQRFATADMLMLIDLMLQSERYFPARDARAKELNAQLEPLGKEVTDLEAKLIMATDTNTNEYQTNAQLWQQKKQQLSNLQQQLSAEYEALNTMQAIEAYRLLVESADAIAAREGYTHVLTARTPVVIEQRFAGNQPALIQQLLARPIVRFPAADDITELIKKDLKLEGVKLPSAEDTRTP